MNRRKATAKGSALAATTASLPATNAVRARRSPMHLTCGALAAGIGAFAIVAGAHAQEGARDPYPSGPYSSGIPHQGPPAGPGDGWGAPGRYPQPAYPPPAGTDPRAPHARQPDGTYPPPSGPGGVQGLSAHVGRRLCRTRTMISNRRTGNGESGLEAMLMVDASGGFRGQGTVVMSGLYSPFSVQGRARLENGAVLFQSQILVQGPWGTDVLPFNTGGKPSPDGRTLSHHESGLLPERSGAR